MPQHTAHNSLGKLIIIGGGALCSRVLGLARDAAIAWLLGGSATADALSAALRLPYVFRRLLGEGTLSLHLTTAYAKMPRTHGRRAAVRQAVTRHLALWAGGLTLVLILAAPVLLRLLASGLQEDTALFTEAVHLFQLCTPYSLTAVLAAGCMAALHSEEHFVLSAATPMLFNAAVLLSAGLTFALPLPPATVLAYGVLCGGMAQWLVQYGAVRRMERADKPASPDLNRPLAQPRVLNRTQRVDRTQDIDQKKADRRRRIPHKHDITSGQEIDDKQDVHLKHVAPNQGAACAPADPHTVNAILRGIPCALLSAATPQLAFVIASTLAALLPEGQLAALFYAERLLEFPLGITGAAVGIAAAPRLAALSTQPSAMAAELQRHTLLSLALNLPAAAGLAAIAVPLVTLTLAHGAFTQDAVRHTALALCAYTPALPAYALSRPLLASCHALEDPHTPWQAALLSLLSAGCFGWLLFILAQHLAPDLMPWAPPLGVGIGLWLNVILLWRGLRKQLPLALPLLPLIRQILGSLGVFITAYTVVCLTVQQGFSPVWTVLLAMIVGIVSYPLLLLGENTTWRLFFPPRNQA